MNENNAELLRAILACSAIWTLWYFGFRPALLASHRQILFAVRDRLFDAALNREHGLTFDHSAYRCIEGEINNTIRFLHRTNPFLALCSFWCVVHKIEPFATVFSGTSADTLDHTGLTQSGRDFLFGIRKSARRVTNAHMFTSWPLSFLLTVGYVVLNHRTLGIPGDIKAARREIAQREGRAVILQAAVEQPEHCLAQAA